MRRSLGASSTGPTALYSCLHGAAPSTRRCGGSRIKWALAAWPHAMVRPQAARHMSSRSPMPSAAAADRATDPQMGSGAS